MGPNGFWILLDEARLEEMKTNALTIIWAWYDHDLLTYIAYARVIYSFVQMIYIRQTVTNFLFEVRPLFKGVSPF